MCIRDRAQTDLLELVIVGRNTKHWLTSGLKSNHLLRLYVAVIRPVFEYHSVIWHHSLTKALSETWNPYNAEHLRITYPPAIGMPYMFALGFAVLPFLWPSWTDKRKFFSSIPSSCIFFILSVPMDRDVTSRLRAVSVCLRPVTRTKRYTSFINYSPLNYR